MYITQLNSVKKLLYLTVILTKNKTKSVCTAVSTSSSETPIQLF